MPRDGYCRRGTIVRVQDTSKNKDNEGDTV